MGGDREHTITRGTYLLQSDIALLNTWGYELRRMFDETPFLVGSSLEHKDFRDVDVRIMLDDQAHDDLAKIADLGRLNLALSLWGQKATGLPIDCQVQHTTSANEDFDGRRHPIGHRLANGPGIDRHPLPLDAVGMVEVIAP